MDTLTEIFDRVRFRGRLFCRVELGAPWGFSAPPSEVATFHGVVRGTAFLALEGAKSSVALSEGDFVVLPHGNAHRIFDRPGSPIAPFGPMLEAHDRDESWVIRHGGRGDRTSIVCGYFSAEGPGRPARGKKVLEGPPFLSLLPDLVHVARDADVGATLAAIERETAARHPGADAVIERQTEILFVQVLRYWLSNAKTGEPSWLAGLSNKEIATALGLIHRSPGDGWTVESLARRVGLSRTVFAELFFSLIGETPIRYLARWRMYAAARDLRDSEKSVSEIAASVGYDSDASLSKAFKRCFGLAPGAYRRARRSLTATARRPIAALPVTSSRASMG